MGESCSVVVRVVLPGEPGPDRARPVLVFLGDSSLASGIASFRMSHTGEVRNDGLYANEVPLAAFPGDVRALIERAARKETADFCERRARALLAEASKIRGAL